MVIDFDDASTWEAALTARLAGHVPADIRQRLRGHPLEYVEDAFRAICAAADRRTVIATTLEWIGENVVAAYHGTRLSPEDEESIRQHGLRPLAAEERRARLVRALSSHHDWPTASGKLDTVLARLGAGDAAGRRVGQVHLTLSRAALIGGFNHYLVYGSEFDQHACHELLGQDGQHLLARDGTARVLRVEVPGALALQAAHPIFSVADVVASGNTPNIVRQLLTVWSYRLADPGYLASKLQPDCGLRFGEAIPSEWIVGFERVEVGPHVALQPWGSGA